jgi:hypothetical protein
MAIADDNVLKVVEETADAVLRRSEGWRIGQKGGASLVCLFASEHRF